MKRWKLAVPVAALLMLLVLAAGREEAMPAAGWGLSFPVPGQPSAGPVTAQQLRELDAAYLDEDGGKVLYLTFDAGYENGYTAQILDVLKERQVSAAFFVTGDYLQRSADLVRRMVREGHIVGNHTMDHPDMSSLEDAAFEAQLQGVEALYGEITGQTLPKFYRPPQGLYSRESLQQARALGYKTVFWSLAYADWDNDHQPDPEAALQKLTGRLHDGAVILLHATSKTNAEILGRLIASWQDMGYRFAPLTELFS